MTDNRISLSYAEKLAALEHATDDERLEIYKEARKLIVENGVEYMCFALEKVCFGPVLQGVDFPAHVFPELMVRKPIGGDIEGSWFDIDERGRKQRIALLDDIIDTWKQNH